MNDDWATIRARRVLEKLSDGAAMNERVEEIRRRHGGPGWEHPITYEYIERTRAPGAGGRSGAMRELTRLAHECCEVLDLDPAEFAVPIEQHLARAVAAITAENERLREGVRTAPQWVRTYWREKCEQAEGRTRALVEFLEDVMSGERILPYQERKWEEFRAALTEPTPPAGGQG
jgi:hypothetical protein